MPLTLDDQQALPTLDHQKLLPRLGLSENKPIPDPVRFTEFDPLGSCTITTVSVETTPSNAGALAGTAYLSLHFALEDLTLVVFQFSKPAVK